MCKKLFVRASRVSNFRSVTRRPERPPSVIPTSRVLWLVAFAIGWTMTGYGGIAIGQVAGVDDPSDMADSSGDIKRIEAWVEDGNLNLTMTVYGVFAPEVQDTPAGMTNRYYYHWLLDTDTDPATGYNNSEYEGNATNVETPIGVDLVVQFGWRDGNTNGVYAYDPLTEVSLFEDYEYTIDGDTIHAVIPLEDLGLDPGQTIALSAYQEGASNDWQVDWIESFELTLTAIESVIFLFDDFESYADDAGLTAAGWTILDTPEVTETGTTWTITNPGGRANPATLNGSASTGNFLISDSDKGGGSNPTDSGASHDVSTPSFSTLGYATVWLHADVSAQLNNNGAAIFDVDVSTDGGSTWTNAFSRVAPGRVSGEGATTRLPDNTNTDGYYGQLDVDLTPYAADQNDVQLRLRHFEPNDDWWIAIDNILIDNVATPQGGPVTVFSEDFSNGLGQMNVVSGQGNTGTETWHTTDKGGRYVPGVVQEQGVNRLGPHPNELPEFAIIDSDANPDPAEDEWLMTPVLDLTGLAEVFLHYESETVMSSGASNQEVLVSLDGGNTFEAAPIFAYKGGGLFDNGEEPAFAERIFDVSSIAAGKSQVVFAFRYAGDGDNWWWAIDNVEVSGSLFPEPVDPGTEGLAALYALDGDANDSSGNGNDGIINNADTGGLGEGGSVWVDDPVHGMVMSFNGDDGSGAYIDTNLIIPPMTMDNGFTWSFWAKQDESQGTEVPGQGNDLILGNRYAADGSDPLEFIKFTPGNFEYYNNDPDYAVTINYDDIPGGVWIHHAGVKDGTTLTYYRNGVEAGTSTITVTIQATPFFMGGISNGERWSGYLSEVGIYDRALSVGEIRYLAGERAVDPSLVIYYDFEGFGNNLVVLDKSGKGNDAVVVGSVSGLAGAGNSGSEACQITGDGSYLDLDGLNFPAEDIPTTAFTLAYWMKPEDTGGTQTVFSALADPHSWCHGGYVRDGQYHAHLGDANNNYIIDAYEGTVEYGAWHHMALTWELVPGEYGGGAMYIDGELVAEYGNDFVEAPPGVPAANNWGSEAHGGARIGWDIDDGWQFSGLLDDFYVFTRALSQDEILAIMQGQ